MNSRDTWSIIWREPQELVVRSIYPLALYIYMRYRCRLIMDVGRNRRMNLYNSVISLEILSVTGEDKSIQARPTIKAMHHGTCSSVPKQHCPISRSWHHLLAVWWECGSNYIIFIKAATSNARSTAPVAPFQSYAVFVSEDSIWTVVMRGKVARMSTRMMCAGVAMQFIQPCLRQCDGGNRMAVITAQWLWL